MFGSKCLALLATAVSTVTSAAPLTVRAHDGFGLVGEIHGTPGAKAGVLLLHQCDMDRRSWSGLLPKLRAAGLTVISVDFRGRGDSRLTESESDAFSHFRNDTAALVSHLGRVLAPDAQIAIIGASCGGNQAFLAAPSYPQVKALVILSGRLSQAEAAWTALARRPDIAVLGIGAVGDGNTVAHARRAVATSQSPSSKLLVYDGALHGVPLFDQDRQLPETIVKWVSARLAE